jgi:hypothetical protein
MNIFIRFGIGVAALALAVGIGAGAYAMYGSDDAPGQRATGAPEIADDASAGGGGGLAMTCIVGTVDCNDTPDIKYDDFGETPEQRCMAEYRDCAEPAPCTPELCDSVPASGCKSGTAPDGTSFETCVGCGYAEPQPGELVDPVAPVDPPVDLPLEAPTIDPAVSGPASDFQIAPDVAPPPPTDFQLPPEFDPEMAGTGCLGIDPCTLSSYSLCQPGDCSISSDGILTCGYMAPCQVEELLPGETEVKPVPADVPCAVGPCFGNDPLAGAPESCPSNPCTVYSPDQPDGVPCSIVESCGIPDPSAESPERGTQTCPPVPGNSGGGSSGSGSNSSSGSSGSGGSVTEPPATEAATPAAQ